MRAVASDGCHGCERSECQFGAAAAMTQTRAVSGAPAGVLVCLLGGFRLMKAGMPISLRAGGKGEQLIVGLALTPTEGVARDELLGSIWPAGDLGLAQRSLNTLVYSLHRLLGDALAGRPPVIWRNGRYRLNTDDGVVVDVAEFDAAVDMGDRLSRAGEPTGALDSWTHAVELYAGDLAVGSDVQHVLERERLRARFLSIHARLADHHLAGGDYARTLVHALAVLAHDPCREDAHRIAMRCYVRLGQRAQALRQYRICRELLAAEFEAVPEPATDELYRIIRLEPERV
jgi:DNA-binding SARP family transcriptional activator